MKGVKFPLSVGFILHLGHRRKQLPPPWHVFFPSTEISLENYLIIINTRGQFPTAIRISRQEVNINDPHFLRREMQTVASRSAFCRGWVYLQQILIYISRFIRELLEKREYHKLARKIYLISNYMVKYNTVVTVFCLISPTFGFTIKIEVEGEFYIDIQGYLEYYLRT